ncbi:MAG: helix-turn-helix domain-containing protein [Victivallaceae bacterium]|jgi:AraC-like DNA-binding protein
MNNFFIKTEFLLYTLASLKEGFVSPSHSHEFWQVEIFRTGQARGIAGKNIFTLSQNDIFVVPPGVTHHFKYDSDSSIISIRFNASGNRTLYNEAFLFPDNPLRDIICYALFEFAESTHSLSESEKIFMEYLLASIVSICDLNAVDSSADNHPAFIKAVNFIEKNKNKYVSITSVAKTAGCSAGHLSALFRKYSGMSLKNYIDRAKSEFIKQYLLYSDLSITDIAELAGFEDIYSFSRFFKRLADVSPNTLRKSKNIPQG